MNNGDPLADLEVRYHSAMPNWCKVLGLKIRVIPDCEGGGFAINAAQAKEIERLLLKERLLGGHDIMVCKERHYFSRERDGLECPRCNDVKTIEALRNALVPTQLQCPECGVQHVDEGEWATKPHRTHLCAACGWRWRPYEVATVGVPATVATSLVTNSCDKIFDHKWLDPVCVDGGCQSLVLKHKLDRLEAVLIQIGLTLNAEHSKIFGVREVGLAEVVSTLHRIGRIIDAALSNAPST